jgi:hypothetical protein
MLNTIIELGIIDNGKYLSSLLKENNNYDINPCRVYSKILALRELLKDINHYLDTVSDELYICYEETFEGGDDFNRYFRENTIYKINNEIYG